MKHRSAGGPPAKKLLGCRHRRAACATYFALPWGLTTPLALATTPYGLADIREPVRYGFFQQRGRRR